MKISTTEKGDMFRNHIPEGLLSENKFRLHGAALESMISRNGVEPEVFDRASVREDEERDLRVLDAYNRFEDGLQKILSTPEVGVMQRKGGEAQSAVFEVSDYFSKEGGRLCDELPDNECRERFMDILASRRRTAVNAVARYQSQEFQKWKDSTVAQTIDSILKAVSVSPDAALLMHGEQLLEGTILRLYRSSNPEILIAKLSSAKQAMYAGALESIAANDPVTAMIVLEGWKEQIGRDDYEILGERFEPLARNQSLKMEFNSLKDLDGEMLRAELEDIEDPEMREELAQMVAAERRRSRFLEERSEIDRINMSCRQLFQSHLNSGLSAEKIVDSGLPAELRSRWRLIFGNEGDGDDSSLLQVVQDIVQENIKEEFQIYAALANGLGKVDASLLAALFELKDNPEAKLMVNALEELAETSEECAADPADLAASIRDFLNRVVSKVGKGELFSITSLRNEVIDDHFGTRRIKVRDKTAEKTDDEAGDIVVRSESAGKIISPKIDSTSAERDDLKTAD